MESYQPFVSGRPERKIKTTRDVSEISTTGRSVRLHCGYRYVLSTPDATQSMVRFDSPPPEVGSRIISLKMSEVQDVEE